VNQVGETTIKYKGADLVLRPDFKALTDIEALLSESILHMIDRFTETKPRLMDIAIVIFCCTRYMESDGAPKSVTEIGAEVLKIGMIKYFNVFECISYVLSGGEEAQKKTESSEQETESNGKNSTE
jgi:hypothetical protein